MSDNLPELEIEIRRRIEKILDDPRISRGEVGDWLLYLSDEYRDPESDDNQITISRETAHTCLMEINNLISATEDVEPDPLTDGTFQARDELQDALTTEDNDD